MSESITTQSPSASSNLELTPLKHILVLDFEATCVQFRTPGFRNEIIEFPTLVFELETNTVTNTFHEYVKPVLNSKLSDFCTELTGIQQATVDSAVTFVPVWNRFLQFLDEHGFTEANSSRFAFLTCGDWDLKTMLPSQASISNTPSTSIHLDARFRRWFNMKVQFRLTYPDKGQNGGMGYFLNALRMKLEGRHHSGIDDCKNIARIVRRMRDDGWEPRWDRSMVSGDRSGL